MVASAINHEVGDHQAVKTRMKMKTYAILVNVVEKKFQKRKRVLKTKVRKKIIQKKKIQKHPRKLN